MVIVITRNSYDSRLRVWRTEENEGDLEGEDLENAFLLIIANEIKGTERRRVADFQESGRDGEATRAHRGTPF